jgi:N-acetylneuraminate synthase
MAVVLGATAIERHLTNDRTMYGSDQAASLEPHGFKSMVDQIRKIPLVLGDGARKVLPAEAETARKLRYWEAKHDQGTTQAGSQGKTTVHLVGR